MLLKIFNKKNLQTKLMMLLVIVFILPLITIGLFFLPKQTRMISENIIQSSNNSISQMADILNINMSTIVSTSSMFYMDEELIKALKEPYSVNDREIMVHSMIDRYNIAIPNISFHTLILDTDGNIYGNALYKNKASYAEIAEKQWYKDVVEFRSRVVWITDKYLDTIFTNPGYPYIYIARELHDFETWEPIGTLIMGFSENYLVSTYGGFVELYENLYIYDKEGNKISQLNNLNVDVDLYKSYEKINLMPNGHLIDTINNEKYLITYATVDVPLWKIVSMKNMKIPMQGAHNIQYSFVILTFIYFAAVIIVSYFVSKRFLVPLHILYNNMQKVKDGNLDVCVTVKTNDEISQLSEQFNDMIIKVKELMKNILIEQESKRKLELKSLQEQVNPHFIYNTLASVRYMVYTGDKKKADTIILSMIKLLKNTLSNMDDLITVEKEFDILRNYIKIQQLASDSPFEVIIDIDEDIRNCYILKLILQPLVENAILHGLKPKKNNRVLKITGRHIKSPDSDDIEFVVSDNGIGCDINKINIDDNTVNLDAGIGIQNVQNRILLHFGKPYGLSIHSTRNAGTDVTVRIPYIVRKGAFTKYEHSDS
jgi:two-component system sensor histidine kinase YesM